MTVFILSSDIYFGFNIELDTDLYKNNDEIIQHIKNELKLFLQKNNEKKILEKINSKKFYIKKTFDEVKKTDICYVYS